MKKPFWTIFLKPLRDSFFAMDPKEGTGEKKATALAGTFATRSLPTDGRLLVP